MNIEIDSKIRIMIERQLIAYQIYLERKVKNSKNDFYARCNQEDLDRTNKALDELRKAKEKAWNKLIEK